MKIRNLPFGYRFKDGQIVAEEKESSIVSEVFRRYLNREYVAMIAQDLKDRRIEYLPNEYEWNKWRVLRIVKDERYLGDGKYIKIVDNETFLATKKLYAEKRTIENGYLKKDIHLIKIPIKCAECGAVMKRRCDYRRKNHEKWYCSNGECKNVVTLKDDIIIKRLIIIMNRIVGKPECVEHPFKIDLNNDIEITSCKAEIERLYENPKKNEKIIRETLEKYFSILYERTDKNIGKTMRLRNRLQNAEPLISFSASLLNEIADAIKLYSDGTVGVVLINGQEIRR